MIQDATEIPIMPEAQKRNLADSRKFITYFMEKSPSREAGLCSNHSLSLWYLYKKFTNPKVDNEYVIEDYYGILRFLELAISGLL